MRLFLTLFFLSMAHASTYSAFDGDSIKISYSQQGLTLIKLSERVKETIDLESFSRHITDDGKSLFISNITDVDKPFFLIFEDGTTLGLEFKKAEQTPQITHHIVLDKVSMHPEKLANDILVGKRFSGFSQKLLTERYKTDNFYIQNKLEMKNSEVIVQKITVTNIKNKLKNLNSLRNRSDVIGFASSKIAILPGETIDVVFVRKN